MKRNVLFVLFFLFAIFCMGCGGYDMGLELNFQTDAMDSWRDLSQPQEEEMTAEMTAFEPAIFLNTQNDPLSTFAADVDTASYTLFRKAVKSGYFIQNALLRSDEMINYFKYNYPEPKAGEPFSITMEYADCPWNENTKLLRIGAKTQKIEAAPASNIVFLLDVSGSMEGEDRIDLLKQAIINMLPTMNDRDTISIVTYASGVKLVLDGANAVKDVDKIKSALKNLKAGGSTNGEGGLKMAYQTAEKHFMKDGNNRIILGTDGDLNVGISTPEELKAFVEEKRKTGVFLSVMGFGYANVKDNNMEALADFGNGSYHYIDSILEAQRVLVDEREATLFVAAKDVKFQMVFNPDEVKGYRLIGYETRKLNNEDFDDDAKDGGEIGSNQQVTVLYEIVPAGSNIEVAALRSMDGGIKNPQDAGKPTTLRLRYKQPNGDVSSELDYPVSFELAASPSEDFRFAAAVAEVGMIINKSKYVGSATFDTVISELKAMSGVKDDIYRSEFLSLVENANNVNW